MREPNLHLRVQPPPGASTWAGLSAPPGFKVPHFVGKSSQMSPNDPKMRANSERLDVMFVSGPRNTIGGAANQYNAGAAFDIAAEAQNKFRELAGRGAESFESGQVMYWALIETLRTVAARGFAYGAIFGDRRQVARSTQAIVSDFLEAGFIVQMEREPGVYGPLFRGHVGFFCAADRRHHPRAYTGFSDAVSEFCQQVSVSHPQFSSEVGNVVRSLPARLFSGGGANLPERAAMLRRFEAEGARLLKSTTQPAA